MNKHERIAIAHHEAGHAVIQWHLGLSPTTVTICPGDGSLGRSEHAKVETPFDGGEPSTAVMNKMILSTLAGPLAEGRITGEDPYRTHAGLDGENAIRGSDLDTVTDLLTRVASMDDCESGAAFDAVEREAQRLVELHWQDIQRVAEKLLEATTLTGRELVRAISPK